MTKLGSISPRLALFAHSAARAQCWERTGGRRELAGWATRQQGL